MPCLENLLPLLKISKVDVGSMLIFQCQLENTNPVVGILKAPRAIKNFFL